MTAHRCSRSTRVIWVCYGLALILLWPGHKISSCAGADKPMNQSFVVSESDSKQRRLSVFYRGGTEIFKRPISKEAAKKLWDQYFQAANILTDAWEIENKASSKHELKKALSKAQQALKVFRSLGSDGMQGLALSDMGRVYEELGEYQKALEHYTEAVGLHGKAANLWDEGSDCAGIGRVYSRLDQHQKSMQAYEKALEIHRKIGDLVGEAADLGGMGGAYWGLGQHHKALDYFDKALATNRKAGYAEGEWRTLELMGQAYGKMGQDAKAKEYLAKAQDIKRGLKEGQKRGVPQNSSGGR